VFYPELVLKVVFEDVVGYPELALKVVFDGVLFFSEFINCFKVLFNIERNSFL